MADLEKLQKIRGLHRLDRPCMEPLCNGHCAACDEEWPCPTIRILDEPEDDDWPIEKVRG